MDAIGAFWSAKNVLRRLAPPVFIKIIYRDTATRLKQYKELDGHLMNASVWDEYLTPEMLSLYNPETDQFEEPKHWLNGKRVGIAILADDVKSSPLLSNKAWRNLCIKCRHLGSFPDSSPPIGCSIFCARSRTPTRRSQTS